MFQTINTGHINQFNVACKYPFHTSYFDVSKTMILKDNICKQEDTLHLLCSAAVYLICFLILVWNFALCIRIINQRNLIIIFWAVFPTGWIFIVFNDALLRVVSHKLLFCILIIMVVVIVLFHNSNSVCKVLTVSCILYVLSKQARLVSRKFCLCLLSCK